MSKTAQQIQAIATRIAATVNCGSPGNAWIADVVYAAMVELHMDRVNVLAALVAGHRDGSLRLVSVDLAPAFKREDREASALAVGKDPCGFDRLVHFVRG